MFKCEGEEEEENGGIILTCEKILTGRSNRKRSQELSVLNPRMINWICHSRKVLLKVSLG